MTTLRILTIALLALAACSRETPSGVAGSARPPGTTPPPIDPVVPGQPPGEPGPAAPGPGPADRDGDGVPDAEDRFPDDPARSASFALVRLDGLSNLLSAATGVNGAGAVVGLSDDGAGAVKGVRWDLGDAGAGAPAALAPLAGGAHAAAYGVSEGGVAVGESEKGADTVAVAWRTPLAAPIELPLGGLAPPAAAYAVAGERVVGEAKATSGAPVAALWDAGAAAAPLGTLPGDRASAAYALAGAWIVGESIDAAGRSRGALWTLDAGGAGTPRPLAALPGHVASVALGVSAAGEIVGESIAAGGEVRAVLWTLDASGAPGAPVDLGRGSAQAVAAGRVAGVRGAPARPGAWDLRNAAHDEPVVPGEVGAAHAVSARGVLAGVAAGRGFAAIPR